MGNITKIFSFFSQKFSILLNSVFFHEIFAFFLRNFRIFLRNFRNSEFLAKQIQAKLREKSENFVFRQECEIFEKQFFFFAGNPLFYLKSFFVEFWEIKILHNQAGA